MIGLYLLTDTLGRFSVGECNSRQFYWLWYDGEEVSINLDTKFYCIKYMAKDVEDTTVADVRIYWVPKEVNNRRKVIQNNKQRSKNVQKECHTGIGEKN